MGTLGPLATAQKGGRPQGAPAGKKAGRLERPWEFENADFIRRRAQWFFHPRAYPQGFVPSGLRLKAIQRMEQLRQGLLGGVRTQMAPGPQTTVTLTSGDWTPIGPQPTNTTFDAPFTSGRVTALAVDPCDPTNATAYLGAADGGVWKTTDSGNTWTPLNIQSAITPVGTIAVGSIALFNSGTNCSVTKVWVGTGEENFAGDNIYGTGVLISSDGGDTWSLDQTFSANQPQNQLAAAPFIGAIAVSPNFATDQTLLASIEGVSTAVHSGVWRSTDAGVHWAKVLPPGSTSFDFGTDVAFDPTDTTGKTVYAALGFPGGNSLNGVYKSTDGGAAWTTSPLPIPGVSGTNAGRIALGVGPQATGGTGGELFAAIADARTLSNNLLGAFKSTNGGTSWTQLTALPVTPSSGFCNSQCFYDLVIKVSPKDPNFVLAGGAAGSGNCPTITGPLIRSTDGGSTWTDISNQCLVNSTQNQVLSLHVDFHTIAFSPDGTTVYVGNDGGVWSASGTTNLRGSPVTWTNLNQNLAITQFYPSPTINPSNPLTLGLGGAQDNGTQRFTGDTAWDATLTCGDGGFTAIDPILPSTVYTDCAYIPNFLLAIWGSDNNGFPNTFTVSTGTFTLNWTPLVINEPGVTFTGGIDPSDRGSFIPPLVADPVSSNILYFATCRAYRSLDGGFAWTAVSPDVTGGSSNTDCPTSVNGVVMSVAVMPGSPSKVVYAASDLGHVARTSDITASSPVWNDVTGSGMLPCRVATSVVLNPSDTTGNTGYVTFSGFSGFTCPGNVPDVAGHVFKTVTGGDVWVSVDGTGSSAPLPNIPVNDLVVDPALPGTLYAATDIGVFTTSNGGVTWAPLGTTLPHVEVLGLRLSPAARVLRASTHGRSMWDFQLTTGFPSFGITTISPASVNAGSGGFTLTVNGDGFTTSSVVNWTAGSATTPLATTFVSSTQLTASVPSNLTLSGVVAQISVANGSMTSNRLPLTVINPVPTLTSISQVTFTPPASSNIAETLTGTGFVSGSSGSVAQITNDAGVATNLSTTFNSATSLTATIPASQLQFGGIYTITVFNPTPGGGQSKGVALIGKAPPPPNDNFSNATPVTLSSGQFTLTPEEDTSGATVETTDPVPLASCVAPGSAVSNGDANSVWFKFTATGNGVLEADTIGSNYDTILSVWTGSPGSFTSVVCNDDIVPGVNRVSQLTFNADFNTTYFFMVSSFTGSGGGLEFHIDASGLTPPPAYSIASSPTSQTVKAGTPATYNLSVTPNGFSGAIAFSCSNLPKLSSCSFNPPSITSPGQTTTQLTIATTANAMIPPGTVTPPMRVVLLYALWALLLAITMAFALLKKRGPVPRRVALGVVLALAAAFLFMQAACGGGKGGGVPTGTPPGTYNILATASPSGPNTSTTVTLVVQ